MRYWILPLLALPLAAQSLTITYQLDSSWGNGLQAEMSIANSAATQVAGWTLAFDYPHNITTVWDARVVSHSGNHYVLAGTNWNPNIPAKGSVSFGWIATVSGTVYSPSGCLVNKVAVSCGGGGTPADTTAPAAPTNLTTTGQTSSSIALAWTASQDNSGGSGIAGYDILKAGSVIGTSTTTTYNATGLASNTSYTFTVRARDNAGNVSAASAALTAKTTVAPSCTTLPGIPTGLTLTSKSSSSLTIGWTAPAPQANCTLSYTLTQDGVASTLSATTYAATGLQPSSSHTFTVAAKNQFGSSNPTAPLTATTDALTPPPPNTWPTSLFAPYVDMLLWPTPTLANLSTVSGVRFYTMAFIVARNTCEAAWGGIIPLTDNFALTDVANLRAQGGNVIVSFGGANGVELAQSCTSVASLQAQYQAVIDMYNLTRIDFDVEGGALADPASIDRRNKAIAGLQATARSRGRQLVVQYTLPVMPTGLTYDGVNLLQNTLQNGVDIGVVNLMAMDYGGPSVADPNKMGQNAVSAMNATFTQMKTLYGSSKTDAQLRAMQGVTPMIGLNDVSPEVFTLTTDAQVLLNAAISSKIGLLAMWSQGRDQMCPGTPQVSSTCSGVTQGAYAFSTFFNAFTMY